MLDDVQEPHNDKPQLTPKPKTEPVPVCTIMSDASIKLEGGNVHVLDLQRMLLSAAINLTARLAQHSMLADRVLQEIDARFEVDEETARAIKTVLAQQ